MNWLPALGLALAVGAPGPKEAPKKAEPSSLVGEWVCATVTSNGRTESRAGAKEQLVYSFSADGQLVVRDGGVWSKSEYAADAKKEPAELDWGGRGAPGGPTLAIYRIEDDTLTLCYAMRKFLGGKAGSAARPKAFEAPVGSPLVLMTFRRVEKKKE